MLKTIVGYSFGVAAWACVMVALPEWHVFSVQTIFIFAAFVLTTIGTWFLDAAKLKAWPWEIEMIVTKNNGLKENCDAQASRPGRDQRAATRR
jgi:hypothetical protein